jgi:probable F420-dependent oxidoreductase
MKVGLSLIMRGRDANRGNALTLAQFAADHAYESIWVSDHFVIPQHKVTKFGGVGGDFPPHWRDGYLESITTLAYLAGRTSGLRLGTSALVLPLRNPVQLARQVATVDLLSEGRAVLAVTAGYAEDEFTTIGASFRDRGARLEEYVRILKCMWASTPATFHGNYFSFDALDCGPLPAQGRALPVLIGGFSTAAIRRAVELGDGWHPAVRSMDQLRRDVERFRVELAKTGRAASEVPISVKLPSFGFEATPDGTLDGTARGWIDAFNAYAELGVDLVVIDYHIESVDYALAMLNWFEQEIRPYTGARS